MDHYIAFVYTIVYGKLSNAGGRQDVEECVSDVFCEVYRTRSAIDPDKGSLKAYLAVLSKRTAIDRYRKLQSNAGDEIYDEFDFEQIASHMDTEKDVIDGETGDRLIRGIKALGEPDSEIMIRKYYFGQSSKTISKALGIKENTVNKKVSRALIKLKGELGGER